MIKIILSLSLVCGLILCCHGRFKNLPPDQNLRTTLKGQISLTCKYDSNVDDAGFLEWYKDDVPVSSEKHGHYQVQKSPLETTLTILIFGIYKLIEHK